MTRYRTGNHWGVTIVREGSGRHVDDCGCTSTYTDPWCKKGTEDSLVAVVVNGDQALAERICELLNAGETAHDEWRVTGDPGDEYGPYQLTWTPLHGPGAEGDPEGKARAFIALIEAHGAPWNDGPHLHRRTVTVTDWEPA